MITLTPSWRQVPQQTGQHQCQIHTQQATTTQMWTWMSQATNMPHQHEWVKQQACCTCTNVNESNDEHATSQNWTRHITMSTSTTNYASANTNAIACASASTNTNTNANANADQCQHQCQIVRVRNGLILTLPLHRDDYHPHTTVVVMRVAQQQWWIAANITASYSEPPGLVQKGEWLALCTHFECATSAFFFHNFCIFCIVGHHIHNKYVIFRMRCAELVVEWRGMQMHKNSK